mmetsp:Transcript_39538/g.80662  ORF Transcript_39538/g.80662 Transcript_39538/m.80662 type:complete len:92 (+) Transcript_39538:874-1149(+)
MFFGIALPSGAVSNGARLSPTNGSVNDRERFEGLEGAGPGELADCEVAEDMSPTDGGEEGGAEPTMGPVPESLGRSARGGLPPGSGLLALR